MDLQMFGNERTGDLVPISGTDPRTGPWQHRAFLAQPLPEVEPVLSPATYRQVARTRAALAFLDNAARQLTNPGLLRRPSLSREAQSTSALEGTYAPLRQVLVEDEAAPSSVDLREVLNYISAADRAFAWIAEGRPLTVGLLCDLQQTLVSGTAIDDDWAGRVRGIQVVIGRRNDAPPDSLPVQAARFVPAPPGLDLDARLRDLLRWMDEPEPQRIDPVVAAALAHYQFESLHPFHDGNGRIGRLLIVLHLMRSEVLSEPTLTVSPWFEERRGEYYDLLLGVSTAGRWDAWTMFFARGLEAAAADTHDQMRRLLNVQRHLRERVRTSRLRSENAAQLINLAVARPSFGVRQVQQDLGISYGRANSLVSQLVALGILAPVDEAVYSRRFHAPDVIDVLLRRARL